MNNLQKVRNQKDKKPRTRQQDDHSMTLHEQTHNSIMLNEKSTFIVILALIQVTLGQECSIAGLCQGTTLSTSAGGDKAQCVELCQGIEGCEYFTYDYDDTFCGAYQDCPTFDETCTSCISGEGECPPLLCSAPGGCIGQLEDEFNVLGTDLTCGSFCQNDVDCTWYTYYPDVGNCLLYSTCQFDSSVCEGCLTSEKDCEEGDGGGSQNSLLLAVTAYTYESISVIDLNNPNSNCESIDIGSLSQTISPQSIQASYLNEQLFLYGDEAELGSYYDDVSGTWSNGPSRSTDRFLPYSLDINETFHLVTGGANNGGLDSSEYYDGSQFSGTYQLPLGVSDHCVIYLGGDEIMLVGYENYNADAFIININSGESTTINFPTTGELTLSQCGLATRSDGSRVAVVAGGGDDDAFALSDTYIYDVNLGVFLPGPPLPETRMFGRAVQYQNSFLIVGGAADAYDTFDARQDILLYDPDNEIWVTLLQKLATPDYVTAALLVSNDFNVNCS